MRRNDDQRSSMFSYLSPEQRVRQDHPLRAIRGMVDEVLRTSSPQFDAMYAREGTGRGVSVGHKRNRTSCKSSHRGQRQPPETISHPAGRHRGDEVQLKSCLFQQPAKIAQGEPALVSPCTRFPLTPAPARRLLGRTTFRGCYETLRPRACRLRADYFL